MTDTLFDYLARKTDPETPRKGDPCVVDDCTKPVLGRGMCSMHYNRWRTHGTTDKRSKKTQVGPCTFEGCAEPKRTRGLCVAHYTQFLRGRPLRRRFNPVERFLGNCKRNPATGCWEWQGTINKFGYGNTNMPTTHGPRLAHRYSYELFVAPIPDGLTIDHLCRVRHCVCPSHLEAVSRDENVRRSPLFNGNKTHCKWGHEFTEENTFWEGSYRKCRACRARRRAEYEARKAAQS